MNLSLGPQSQETKGIYYCFEVPLPVFNNSGMHLNKNNGGAYSVISFLRLELVEHFDRCQIIQGDDL